jgi:hypothetical protein
MSAPAPVRNTHLDYLTANPLGRALYAPVFDSREQRANAAVLFQRTCAGAGACSHSETPANDSQAPTPIHS